MSNHDGGTLVRHAIERLPPQSFALGVESGSRLIKQQHQSAVKQSAAALVAAAHLVERGLRPNKADVLGDTAGEENQILRHEGELPPEIGRIERRAGGRGEAGRFKIRFERIASVSRPRLRRLQMRTAPRCKRHRGREIVLDAEEPGDADRQAPA
jgi:hypothetical protein